jgi:hypothetical protein
MSMLSMQYLAPVNFPKPDGTLDMKFVDISMRLKGVHLKGTFLPNSKLFLKLNFFIEGASLDIKKGDELVFVNVFCVEGENAPRLFNVVQGLYKEYNLGFAQLPMVGNWIHSVPVHYELLTKEEVRLCEKITTAFYWGLHAKREMNKKKLN